MPAGAAWWIRFGCLCETPQGRFGGEPQPGEILARGALSGVAPGLFKTPIPWDAEQCLGRRWSRQQHPGAHPGKGLVQGCVRADTHRSSKAIG